MTAALALVLALTAWSQSTPDVRFLTREEIAAQKRADERFFNALRVVWATWIVACAGFGWRLARRRSVAIEAGYERVRGVALREAGGHAPPRRGSRPPWPEGLRALAPATGTRPETAEAWLGVVARGVLVIEGSTGKGRLLAKDDVADSFVTESNRAALTIVFRGGGSHDARYDVARVADAVHLLNALGEIGLRLRFRRS